MVDNIYNKPEYWCGDIGYRHPGYGDFWINALKELCILSMLPTSTLDIGCAYGYSVARLRALGLDIEGIDISSYALEKANPNIMKYLAMGTVWNLPYEDKSFDLIFSSGVLEHIPKNKLEKSISEIRRVGHRGLIGVSCTDDPSTNLAEKDKDTTHEVVLSQVEWQKLFPPEFRIVSDSSIAWTRTCFEMVASRLTMRQVAMNI